MPQTRINIDHFLLGCVLRLCYTARVQNEPRGRYERRTRS